MYFNDKNIANCLALYCRHLQSHATRHVGLCGETIQRLNDAKCEDATIGQLNFFFCNVEFIHEVYTHIQYQ